MSIQHLCKNKQKMPVYVWESQTGTVTISGTVDQGIVDNLSAGNINVTADGMLVQHDRVTVLNKLQQLGYRQIRSAVPGEGTRAGWRFWVLEK